MLLEGNILNGKYIVKKLLGKGAMGSAYLVQRLTDNKEMVVKELNFSSDSGLDGNAAREIFFREAEFMATFNHPGLPKMYGVFIENGNDYLTMDYIKGRTLEQVINTVGKAFSEDRAIRWAIKIADILDYLHNSFSKPIVYKDLKPSNIIIDRDDNPVIIDFGITRYYNPDKDTDTFRLGSPGYAPPEQYKGRGQTSPQSDIFALGVVLYQLLTNYDPSLTPFKFPPMKTLNNSISSDLENIILKAVNLNPLMRYISVRDFKEHLEKYLERKFSYQPPVRKNYPYSPPSSQICTSVPPVSVPSQNPPVNPLMSMNVSFLDFLIPLCFSTISMTFCGSTSNAVTVFIIGFMIWLPVWVFIRLIIVNIMKPMP